MLRPTNRPLVAYFDAIKNLRLRQLALILKAGYDPNLMLSARGQNGLQYLVHYYGSTDAHFRLQVPLNKSAYLAVAKLLLDSGLDPNAADLLTDETIIFDAIRYNDKDMVSLLLNYADLAIRNKNGETPLMCAARFGTKPVIRMILEHLRQLEMDGYFLRQRNRFGLTALELARSENIEGAKVLTKHLITNGHHTNAVLARSTSHHQLYHMRPAYNPRTPAVAAAAAAFLDVDSASDFEDEVLASGVYNPIEARRAYGGPTVSLAAAAATTSGTGVSGSRRRAPLSLAMYDSKAAEFNQYLLDQQEFGSGAEQQVAGGAMSDEEDYLAGPSGMSGGTSGALTRSRSCMLGPNACGGSKSQKYSVPSQAAKKSDGASGAPKLTGSAGGWNDSGAGSSGAGVRGSMN